MHLAVVDFSIGTNSTDPADIKRWHTATNEQRFSLLDPRLLVTRFAKNRPIRFAIIKLFNILVNVGLNLLLIVVLREDIEAIFLSNLVATILC